MWELQTQTHVIVLLVLVAGKIVKESWILCYNLTMEISMRRSMEEVTKVAQEKGSDPLAWALEMYSNLNSSGKSLPSSELAEFLVSYICWDNNVPIIWKFLEKALILNIVPPMVLLALLSVRFVSFLNSHPLFTYFLNILIINFMLIYIFFFAGLFLVDMLNLQLIGCIWNLSKNMLSNLNRRLAGQIIKSKVKFM